MSPPSPPSKPYRLLWVDDDVLLLRVLSKKLHSFGFEIEMVHDKANAIARLSSDGDAFDLVVTDETLPDGSGHEIAAEARKRAPTRPVLFFSGSSLPRKSGIIEHTLSKGVPSNVLIATISRLCNHPEERHDV